MIRYSTFVICLVIAIAASCFTTYYFTRNNAAAPVTVVASENTPGCSYNKLRLNGYDYVRPLLLAEPTCPSTKLSGIRDNLMSIINAKKQEGFIENASVFLMAKGEWMTIGENEKYLPGSLMKIPELITFMKMTEKNPGLLDKKVSVGKHPATVKNVVFKSKTIEENHTYTVRELLEYMIVYSDNNATILLNNMMDLNVFKKVFTDLGLAAPDLSQKDIPLSAKEVSVFMRAIYNATYLSFDNSELCAKLLSRADFHLGMMAGLPKGVKAIHKFGEAGDAQFAHFSESAIVYLPSGTYMLTVMAKGKNINNLPLFVKQISEAAYNNFRVS